MIVFIDYQIWNSNIERLVVWCCPTRNIQKRMSLNNNAMCSFRCGLRQNGAIFFTFNGCYLGDSPRAANSSKLYATVSALGMSLKCKFNFDGPFLFDPSLAVSQADIDQLYLTQAPIPFIRGLFSAIKTPKAPLVRAPKWDCNMCTFTNQPSRSTCEMCEHPCPPHVQAIKSSAAKRLCEGIMVGSEVMLSQVFSFSVLCFFNEKC